MYGTFNLTNLFQENFVLLWSLGVFWGGRKKIPKVGRSQLCIKQFIKQLLHKHCDPVVSLLLRHSDWVDSAGGKTSDGKLNFKNDFANFNGCLKQLVPVSTIQIRKLVF